MSKARDAIRAAKRNYALQTKIIESLDRSEYLSTTKTIQRLSWRMGRSKVNTTRSRIA